MRPVTAWPRARARAKATTVQISTAMARVSRLGTMAKGFGKVFGKAVFVLLPVHSPQGGGAINPLAALFTYIYLRAWLDFKEGSQHPHLRLYLARRDPP